MLNLKRWCHNEYYVRMMKAMTKNALELKAILYTRGVEQGYNNSITKNMRAYYEELKRTKCYTVTALHDNLIQT